MSRSTCTVLRILKYCRWYCEVPGGTLRAYSFLKSKMFVRFRLESFQITYIICSCNIDVNPTSTQALVAQIGGRAHLVGIGRDDGKGKVEQVYCIKDEAIVPRMTHEFGAVFTNQGQTVLFGSVDGCVVVWDKSKGDVACVLDHCEGECTLCICLYDIERLPHR